MVETTAMTTYGLFVLAATEARGLNIYETNTVRKIRKIRPC